MERFTYDEAKCIESKNILRRYSVVRNIYRSNFSHSDKIGNCARLFDKLQPLTTIDFYIKYLSYAQHHISEPISKRGLTYDELYNTALLFQKQCEEVIKAKYDLETYFYCLVCHIIYETFQGQNIERQFCKYIQKLGYKCEKFPSYLDTIYGLDLKVGVNDKTYGIQIKPKSFIAGNRTDLVKDQIALCIKYENTIRELNIKTYYAFYSLNKDGQILWLKNNNNGFRFKINELFEYDPTDIGKSFVKKELNYNNLSALE